MKASFRHGNEKEEKRPGIVSSIDPNELYHGYPAAPTTPATPTSEDIVFEIIEDRSNSRSSLFDELSSHFAPEIGGDSLFSQIIDISQTGTPRSQIFQKPEPLPETANQLSSQEKNEVYQGNVIFLEKPNDRTDESFVPEVSSVDYEPPRPQKDFSYHHFEPVVPAPTNHRQPKFNDEEESSSFDDPVVHPSRYNLSPILKNRPNSMEIFLNNKRKRKALTSTTTTTTTTTTTITTTTTKLSTTSSTTPSNTLSNTPSNTPKDTPKNTPFKTPSNSPSNAPSNTPITPEQKAKEYVPVEEYLDMLDNNELQKTFASPIQSSDFHYDDGFLIPNIGVHFVDSLGNDKLDRTGSLADLDEENNVKGRPIFKKHVKDESSSSKEPEEIVARNPVNNPFLILQSKSSLEQVEAPAIPQNPAITVVDQPDLTRSERPRPFAGPFFGHTKSATTTPSSTASSTTVSPMAKSEDVKYENFLSDDTFSKENFPFEPSETFFELKPVVNNAFLQFHERLRKTLEKTPTPPTPVKVTESNKEIPSLPPFSSYPMNPEKNFKYTETEDVEFPEQSSEPQPQEFANNEPPVKLVNEQPAVINDDVDYAESVLQKYPQPEQVPAQPVPIPAFIIPPPPATVPKPIFRARHQKGPRKRRILTRLSDSLKRVSSGFLGNIFGGLGHLKSLRRQRRDLSDNNESFSACPSSKNFVHPRAAFSVTGKNDY